MARHVPVHNHVFDAEQPVCKVCGYNPEKLLEEEQIKGVPLNQTQAVKLAGLLREHDGREFRLTNGVDGWVEVVVYDAEGEPVGNIIQLPPQ